MKLPTELANQSAKEFLEVFQNLYEHSPWFVEQSLVHVAADDKYNNLEKFHQLLSEIMLQAKSELQDNLIVAHPMLAGKKAQNNELTDFSTTEQKSAGLNDCSDNEIELFKELNNKYFSKFNFPFIMAVKEKNKSEILVSFKKRQENSHLQERLNALNEINKIAWLRIKEIYGL
ncbi:MAG: 2-oxo-4-hydroxy-4-carboxy-5-ureidoimidazoline decarboxylase [Candidatus Pseudothioglobus sp.]|mgnify:FL=1|jgi:2-oxo-4-hydroxy-4-carboxy-5-ureidoimidazoline decarboxylase|nr:2-oxo-4-hydroxy-4-carboxy-5-ureidoimidazoline decarboxylase [Candidatus Thioglobus sp.]|tara:strand:+ start:36 stop:557 length:522 start_codon:yes stop_codon:yes gene_type:complete